MVAVRRPATAAESASVGLALLRAARTAWIAASARSLHDAARRVLDVHGIQLTVRGEVAPGPAILVANHLGYLDPLVIASAVECTPIAKSELSGWPLLGRVARRIGVLFIRRGDALSGARVLLAARRRLRAGMRVLNFPEGTTSLGSGVQRFHRGIFGLARLCQVPVVPIALSCPRELCWAGDELFLPHYARTAARRSSNMTVELGRPLDARAFDDADALSDEARRRIHRMLRRL